MPATGRQACNLSSRQPFIPHLSRRAEPYPFTQAATVSSPYPYLSLRQTTLRTPSQQKGRTLLSHTSSNSQPTLSLPVSQTDNSYNPIPAEGQNITLPHQQQQPPTLSLPVISGRQLLQPHPSRRAEHYSPTPAATASPPSPYLPQLHDLVLQRLPFTYHLGLVAWVHGVHPDGVGRLDPVVDGSLIGRHGALDYHRDLGRQPALHVLHLDHSSST